VRTYKVKLSDLDATLLDIMSNRLSTRPEKLLQEQAEKYINSKEFKREVQRPNRHLLEKPRRSE
jgi:hypothetical protein